jgi:hypothetical protein
MTAIEKELRAQRDELLDIIYSMPVLITRAWERRTDADTNRLLNTLHERITAAKLRAKAAP